MSKKCYECRSPKPDNGLFMCEKCIVEGRRMTPIPVHGLSDGPGSAVNEIVFERPDAKKNIALTCKKMEELGALKDPKMKALCDYKMKKAKEMPDQPKVDYGVSGHPTLDNGSE
jgi:hypothetical protein